MKSTIKLNRMSDKFYGIAIIIQDGFDAIVLGFNKRNDSEDFRLIIEDGPTYFGYSKLNLFDISWTLGLARVIFYDNCQISAEEFMTKLRDNHPDYFEWFLWHPDILNASLENIVNVIRELKEQQNEET